jgi:hypothetical protein
MEASEQTLHSTGPRVGKSAVRFGSLAHPEVTTKIHFWGAQPVKQGCLLASNLEGAVVNLICDTGGNGQCAVLIRMDHVPRVDSHSVNDDRTIDV